MNEVPGRDSGATWASARAGTRHLFVRDLMVDARIGVYDSEKQGTQRVRVNLDLTVSTPEAALNDDVRTVVSYEPIVRYTRRLAREAHIELIETFAERLAAHCLAHPMVLAARVRVEKLDIFHDAASVGVEIERIKE
ncbi:MAG: dihydroneopterin aldolase [Azospirillaceae bacterium]